MSGTLSDYFDDEESFEDILSAAEDNAVTSWEMQFCDGFRRRFETYRLETFMTEEQHHSLLRIAQK